MTIYVPGKLILANEPFRGITATGGDSVFDIAQNGIRYRVHVFTTVGNSTFTVTDPGSGLHPGIGGTTVNSVEYLIVAGGGGGGSRTFGGNYGAGGGGAGGYRCSVSGELSGGNSISESPVIVTPGSNTVTVGAGGAGASANTTNSGEAERGFTGQPSSVFGIVALGGGGADRLLDCGSGGGQNANSVSSPISGTLGQGSAGGGTSGEGGVGGGGGGAGANGNAGSTTGNGNGGDGIASLITGSSVIRGGGGGGGAGGVGGAGGGGDGGPVYYTVGSNGTANTGGGGGGAASSFFNLRGGGNGGSGIVIVRYAI